MVLKQATLNRDNGLTESKRSKEVNRDIMWRIWRGWIAKYLPRFYFALFLMVVVAASSSAYPILTKYIFNGLAEGRAAACIHVFEKFPVGLGSKLRNTGRDKKSINSMVWEESTPPNTGRDKKVDKFHGLGGKHASKHWQGQKSQ